MKRSFPTGLAVLSTVLLLRGLWGWVTRSRPDPALGLQPMNRVPIRVLTVELEAPLPAIPAFTGAERYHDLRLLVRLHRQPLGTLDLPLSEPGMTAETLATHIWRALGEAINAHLAQDGLPPVRCLPAAGLPPEAHPRCQRGWYAVRQAPLPVSVVLCTRDRTPRLAPLLEALRELDYPNYEVVIVDNAPSDETTRILVEEVSRLDSRIRYICEMRAGLSNARNAGVRAARADLIAMTDDDVHPDPQWLLALVEGFESGDGQREVGCVTGPAPALRLDTISQVQFEQHGGFDRGYEHRIFDLGLNRPADSILFPYSAGKFGSGVNMAFRRSALERGGGFDPALGAGTPAGGGEDLAIFVELLLAGYQLVYQPAALVHHDHRADEAALRRQLHAYGTGLTAYLTSLILRDPRRILGLAWRVPAGLVHILRPSLSPQSNTKGQLPADLLALERRGMLQGPWVYLRTWQRVRRQVPPQASSAAAASG